MQQCPSDSSRPAGAAREPRHSQIYKSLFVQSRGVLAKELTRHLRSGRPTRRSLHHSVSGQWRSQIRDAVSIRERPAEADDRAVPGHWEGDLLLGRGLTQIATVVERSTRYTVLVRLAGRDMTSVTAALSTRIAQLPAEVRKTLTWDRGMELAGHKRVTAAPAWPSTSPTPAAPGSAARTRTPIDCCASTSPKAPPWGISPRPTSTPSPTA